MFWYLLPFIAIAFVLSLVFKQIPLSDVAGLVARGKAVGGAEAEELDRACSGPVPGKAQTPQ